MRSGMPKTSNASMKLSPGKYIYFASDNHLGAPTRADSLSREKHFVAWLDHIAPTAEALFLMGDLFDFWFEYKTVIPKGHIRVLGKLAELSDSGLPIHYFVGNHDMWMNGYFEEEMNIPVYHKPMDITVNDTRFFIGHGDGLGPGDTGYKRMKKIFSNGFFKWLFRWLHPDIGVRVAQYLSVKNKLISGKEDVKFLGEDQEWLAQYCRRKEAEEHRDYYVFGHRHMPLEIAVNDRSTYFNIGDWITHFTYGRFDGRTMALLKYPMEH